MKKIRRQAGRRRTTASRTFSRARVTLIASFFVVLILLLLVEGFTTKTVGASSTGPGASGASPLAGAGPILTAKGNRLVSIGGSPGRRVALTFDDGPDPHWTPKIVAILKRDHVPATFFMMGSAVVRNPGLVKSIAQDGFQIGNHTFTHPDLAALPGWERSLQLSLNETAISGITGRRPRLMRPPYSSTPDAVTPAEIAAWLPLARSGYVITLTNYDTEDWNQPGVSSIVKAATPPGKTGGIVLMHDAGGRRAETVAALPQVIDRIRARGFRFVRVSNLAGLSRSAVELPATQRQRLRGQLFVTMLAIAGFVTNNLTKLVEAVTILVGLRMLAALILPSAQVRRSRRARGVEPLSPPVSILVPAFDEAKGIARSVQSLAGSQYPGEFEVIVVDDGSRDGTGAIVSGLALPRVRLVSQANTGKPAALNRALEAAKHDFIVTVDADTVFEKDALMRLVQHFRDPTVGAVSGNTKVGNRRRLLGRWQHIEYVMGFNLERRMYEILGFMPTVPGAIGAFRREALVDIGGVSGATLAEDTDITLDIGRAGWRVVYAEDARAWTEAPGTVRGLFRQRSRWAYGTIQSIWKHRSALWSRSGGGFGRRAIAYLAVFQVALPLVAPLIDLFAVYSILFLDPLPILAFWFAFNAFQFLLAWVAFGFDGESRRVLWALPAQQFLYRQVMYLVVIDAVISALLGTRLGWRRAERTGEIELSAA
jgi:cellulose synthase/poly-beta-1,6-N-acetylglucosamine synthase-like glycosyltransferase/peptidoglycan/xylan/chitin deacetylase (PgdA/CDA1 family)